MSVLFIVLFFMAAFFPKQMAYEAHNVWIKMKSGWLKASQEKKGGA